MAVEQHLLAVEQRHMAADSRQPFIESRLRVGECDRVNEEWGQVT